MLQCYCWAGMYVVHAFAGKQYCDIPEKAPKKILCHTEESPKAEEKMVEKSIHLLVFIFKFGKPRPKIQTENFIALLSLMFR